MFDDNLIEKMVELGIGMSVMRQMPNMMDGMMPQNDKTIAQTPPPLNPSSVTTYVAINGQQAGPLTDEELKLLIANHVLTADTLVWTPQLANWTAAKHVPSVNKLILLSEIGNNISTPASAVSNSSIRNDVVDAIARLGYNNASVRKIVADVLAGNPSITTSDAVKEVLKQL